MGLLPLNWDGATMGASIMNLFSQNSTRHISILPEKFKIDKRKTTFIGYDLFGPVD